MNGIEGTVCYIYVKEQRIDLLQRVFVSVSRSDLNHKLHPADFRLQNLQPLIYLL